MSARARFAALSFSLLSITVTALSCRAGVVLVEDGRPRSVIVSADPAAAAELQSYLRKMTGATVPIGEEPPRQTPSIRIGVFGQAPVREWGGTAPATDGFVIEPIGRNLYIVGGSARGALYGVYDFLENDLGVRWFMPGEMGEDVPQRRTIVLPRRGRRRAPAFSAVGGFAWMGGPGAAEWERHVRAVVGPPNAFFGHNWSNIIPPTPEMKARYRDWFALKDGARTHQLCTAHPEVVRITVAKAREFFTRHPDARVFSISPNDGDGLCEDEKCRRIDALYGVTDGSTTDRLVHYANQVLEELGRTHPDKQVGILAYWNYIRPPVAAKPHPNLATMITRMPWEFCHVHSLDDRSCPLSRRFVEYVDGWRRVSRNVSVYDYYGHFHVFTPWPLLHTIRRDLPLLQRLGVSGFMSETQQHWANQGLNFYVGAKLAWDPSLDVDALLEDYFSRFYGPAAVPLRRYWMAWEDAMVATAGAGHGGYEWLRMFTPERVAECDALLAEGERRATEAGVDTFAKRVALARAGFRFTEAWARMRRHGERGAWAEAVAAGEESIRRIRETDGSEPQAFWVSLAVDQTEAALKPFREALAAGR